MQSIYVTLAGLQINDSHQAKVCLDFGPCNKAMG